MEWLQVMVQSTIVMTFIGCVFSYFILRPLNASIQKLDKSVEKLGERSQMMDLRLVKVEESTKSAHHRIDHLEESITERR